MARIARVSFSAVTWPTGRPGRQSLYKPTSTARRVILPLPPLVFVPYMRPSGRRSYSTNVDPIALAA